MFAIDDPRGLVEKIAHVLTDPLDAGGAVMVIGRGDKGDGAPALLFRERRIMTGDPEQHHDAGCIIERPSNIASVCAMIRMFSSLMPGSTPQTFAVSSPLLRSISARNRKVTSLLVSIASRIAVPSFMLMVSVGPVVPAPASGSVVTLPGMSMTISTIAAPALLARIIEPLQRAK